MALPKTKKITREELERLNNLSDTDKEQIKVNMGKAVYAGTIKTLLAPLEAVKNNLLEPFRHFHKMPETMLENMGAGDLIRNIRENINTQKLEQMYDQRKQEEKDNLNGGVVSAKVIAAIDKLGDLIQSQTGVISSHTFILANILSQVSHLTTLVARAQKDTSEIAKETKEEVQETKEEETKQENQKLDTETAEEHIDPEEKIDLTEGKSINDKIISTALPPDNTLVKEKAEGIFAKIGDVMAAAGGVITSIGLLTKANSIKNAVTGASKNLTEKIKPKVKVDPDEAKLNKLKEDLKENSKPKVDDIKPTNAKSLLTEAEETVESGIEEVVGTRLGLGMLGRLISLPVVAGITAFTGGMNSAEANEEVKRSDNEPMRNEIIIKKEKGIKLTPEEHKLDQQYQKEDADKAARVKVQEQHHAALLNTLKTNKYKQDHPSEQALVVPLPALEPPTTNETNQQAQNRYFKYNDRLLAVEKELTEKIVHGNLSFNDRNKVLLEASRVQSLLTETQDAIQKLINRQNVSNNIQPNKHMETKTFNLLHDSVKSSTSNNQPTVVTVPIPTPVITNTQNSGGGSHAVNPPLTYSTPADRKTFN